MDSCRFQKQLYESNDSGPSCSQTLVAAPAFAGSPPGRFHFGPQQAVCIHGQMTKKVRHSGSICICKDDVICWLRSYGKESEMTLITTNHGKTFLTSVTAMPASSLLLQPSWARPGLATGSLMQGPTLILRLPRNTVSIDFTAAAWTSAT